MARIGEKTGDRTATSTTIERWLRFAFWVLWLVRELVGVVQSLGS